MDVFNGVPVDTSRQTQYRKLTINQTGRCNEWVTTYTLTALSHLQSRKYHAGKRTKQIYPQKKTGRAGANLDRPDKNRRRLPLTYL